MTVTLKQLRQRKVDRSREIERNLDNIRRQLEAMGALKIILFGSHARGRTKSGSDLDIICVMPSARAGKEWMGRIYSEIERSVDCDILAYTPEELETNIPVSRFLRHALENGRVVYERGHAG